MSPPTYLNITLPSDTAISLDTFVSTPPRGSTTGSFPSLLFLHFWGGTNRTYSPTLKHLCTDYDIIAPTLRGWGDSSKPQDVKAYGIRQNADDIADLVRYLQDSREYEDLLHNGLVIVGHSMGAKIAQLLLTYPDLQPLIQGLVLIAPAPVTPLRFSAEMRAQQRKAYSSLEIARVAIQHTLLGRPDIFQKSGGEPGNSTELEVLIQDAFSGSEGAKSAWPEYGMSEDYSIAVRDAVQTQNAADRRVKVLVVVGGLDRVETPAAVRANVVGPLEQGGVSVIVEEIADTGHLIPMEAPEQLAQKIRTFLREHLARGVEADELADMQGVSDDHHFDFGGDDT